jgi:diguanylate cyclase (GGDEF)-like protein
MSDEMFASQPTILVVDDDPVLTMLIGGILAKTGKIFTARSGDEGLRLASKENPDLILLDVQMPGKDGFDVISELKMDPALRHIPVIFITGEVIPEIESHCLEAGAADYIAKPVTPRVLQARARTHLLLKQQADMLADLSYLDPLTGAMNRGAFQERFDSEVARAASHGRAVSVLVVDVDQLDAYNQTYGYAAGDDVLVKVVRAVIAQAKRPGDVVARVTGERLVVLLPETDAAEAARVGDRIVAAVREMGLRHGKSTVADVVTVGIGAATAVNPSSPQALLSAAESALVTAKAAGSNRVNAANPL